EIDARVGDADVVEHSLQFFLRNLAAQHLLHSIAEARGLFHAQAGPGAKMQANQARIHLRKEVLAKKEHQPQRQNAENHKANGEESAVFQRGFQQSLVAATEFFEPALEFALEY